MQNWSGLFIAVGKRGHRLAKGRFLDMAGFEETEQVSKMRSHPNSSMCRKQFSSEAAQEIKFCMARTNTTPPSERNTNKNQLLTSTGWGAVKA